MPKKISLTGLKNWVESTEMFSRPSKRIPGKWELFEFYFEPGKDLVHLEEKQMKIEKLFFEVYFAADEVFVQKSNLNVPLISKIVNGNWSLSRNFVTIINPDNFRDNVEFQFAVERGILKLLKKDAFGKIEFFGFFRKLI